MSTPENSPDENATNFLEILETRLNRRRRFHNYFANLVAFLMFILLAAAFLVFFFGSWIGQTSGAGTIEQKLVELETTSEKLERQLGSVNDNLNRISGSLISSCADVLDDEEIEELRRVTALHFTEYRSFLVIFFGGESGEAQILEEINEETAPNGLIIQVENPSKDFVHIKNNEKFQVCRTHFEEEAKLEYDRALSLQTELTNLEKTLQLIEEQATLREVGLWRDVDPTEISNAVFIQNNITRFGAIICIIVFLVILLPVYKYHVNRKAACEIALDKLLALRNDELLKKALAAGLFNTFDEKLESVATAVGVKDVLSLFQKS